MSRWTWVSLLLCATAFLAAATVLAIRLLRRRRRAQGDRPADAAPKARPKDQALFRRRLRLRGAIAAELDLLKANVSGADHRYRIPWCLAVGRPQAGQSTVLDSTGLHRPISSDEAQRGQPSGCRWNYFDRGIVIDVSSELVESEELFRTILGLLRRARSRRPIDCLLLTIPATELLDVDSAGAVAGARAEALYRRLLRLQTDLGLCVSTYLLVTRCDVIPGFVPFTRALGERHRAQMLGWSNPNPPTATYANRWVDEAFEAVYQMLCLHQLDLLAKDDLAERDLVFAFPSALRQLKEPLRRFLDQIFGASVYHESHILRGIYFCGDATDKGAVVSHQGGVVRRPSFVQQLFEEKVFPEYGVSRPVARSLISSNRLLLLSRLGFALSIVLGAAVLWAAAVRLGQDTRTVVEYLTSTIEDAAFMQAEKGEIDRARFEQRAQNLLASMTNISTNRLRRLRIPSSLFSSIDDDLSGIMKTSFEDVILSGLRSGLEYKSIDLFGRQAAQDPLPLLLGFEPPPAGESVPRTRAPVLRLDAQALDVQSLSAMPEYLRLRGLADDFVEFRQNQTLYNGLSNRQGQSLDSVSKLVKYVFKSDLGDGFKRNSALYEDALSHATYQIYDDPSLDPNVRRRLKALSRDLERRLFFENPIDLQLAELQDLLNRLRAEGDWNTPDLGRLRNLVSFIDRLQQDIRRSEASWIGREPLDLGDSYRDLLAVLRQAPSGRELSDEIESNYRSSFRQLQRKIFLYQTPITGPLLVREDVAGKLRGALGAAASATPAAGAAGKAAQGAATDALNGLAGKLLLGPQTLALRGLIDGFLSQSFVRMEDELAAPPSVMGSYRVIWEEEPLRQALSFADTYQLFARDRLGQFHEELRDPIRRKALERLQRSMRILVLRARRIEKVSRLEDLRSLEEQVAAEVSDLRRVLPLLQQIISTYDRLGLVTALRELQQQTGADARDFLRRLETLLEGDELYKPSPRLSAWRGGRPLAYDVFDADDIDRLQQYVRAQRARIRFWANDFAEPPVTLLAVLGAAAGGGGVTDPLALKWQRILSDLTQFDKVTPANALKDLETFIDTTLPAITADNCVERLPRRSGDAVDFFLQKRARVYDAARRRCLEYIEQKLQADYVVLAAQFNRDLGGRFPFSRDDVGVESEAAPSAVQQFFRSFDEYIKGYDAYIKRGEAQSPQLASALSREPGWFLGQMRAIRGFLGPLLGDKSNDEIVRCEVQADFRVNRPNEENGNQIIDWTLLLGGRRVGEKPVPWRFGDKVSLTFRWAKDGPYGPRPTGQPRSAQAILEDSAVRFDWAGRWGLVRMLRQQQTGQSDFVGSVEYPNTLRFVMPIGDRRYLRILPEERNADALRRRAQEDDKVRLYLRLYLSPPESKARVEAPDEWPYAAPDVRL